MEFLQQLVNNSEFPVISAFILGIMMAISPCPLAMNITATAYLSKEINDKKRVLFNGLFYTLGRIMSYTTLAAIIYVGASKFQVIKWFQQINPVWIGIAFIIIGILMFDFIKVNIPFVNNITSSIGKRKIKRNYFNAFLIGILFALAFCPYSGVLYFGVLIPMTLTNPSGLLLPPVFAVATGLPVIIIAYLLAYSFSNIGKFYTKMKNIDVWLRRIVASIFVLTGIYYIIINL